MLLIPLAYRGTLVTWNLSIAEMNAFSTFVGIMLEGKLKGFQSKVKILNIYRLYEERIFFWTNCFNPSC